MLTPSAVSLFGGSNAFAGNIIAKYKEVAQLCADENDGPNDTFTGAHGVSLKEYDSSVTFLNLSGTGQGQYSIDHGQDFEGRRVVESFNLDEKKQLHYSRYEEIHGLGIMDTEWTLESDGGLTTTQGTGSRFECVDLGDAEEFFLAK
mgnify:CR=1 FL=1